MARTRQQFMRLLVLFDLPVKSAQDKRHYVHFRNFLLQDGYDMLQYSVYSRICNGIESVHAHAARLARHIPPKGSVRSLCITEKQHQRMRCWLGVPTSHEQSVKSRQLVLL